MRLLNNRFVSVKRERTNTVLGFRYLNNTSTQPQANVIARNNVPKAPAVPPYTQLVKAGRNVVKRDRNNTTINVLSAVNRGGVLPVTTGAQPVYRCFKVKRDLELHDTTVNRPLSPHGTIA